MVLLEKKMTALNDICISNSEFAKYSKIKVRLRTYFLSGAHVCKDIEENQSSHPQ